MKNLSLVQGNSIPEKCRLCNLSFQPADKSVVILKSNEPTTVSTLKFHFTDLCIRSRSIPKAATDRQVFEINRSNKRLQERCKKVSKLIAENETLELSPERLQIANQLFKAIKTTDHSNGGEFRKIELSEKLLTLVYLHYFPQRKRNKKRNKKTSSLPIAINV